MGRVRAQVALDLDFTASEETAERYEPRQEPGLCAANSCWKKPRIG
ncbi:MAG: hypothetical protein IPL99_04285 [Candidatus Competibacteraceae bacterium]|nr:hypothetical protein [Candidatus Competibacteraceae bacterium]